jgi:hypothetical protein
MQSCATCRFQDFNDAYAGALLHHDDFAFRNDASVQGNLKRLARRLLDFEDLPRRQTKEVTDWQPQTPDLNAHPQGDVVNARQVSKEWIRGGSIRRWN